MPGSRPASFKRLNAQQYEIFKKFQREGSLTSWKYLMFVWKFQAMQQSIYVL